MVAVGFVTRSPMLGVRQVPGNIAFDLLLQPWGDQVGIAAAVNWSCLSVSRLAWLPCQANMNEATSGGKATFFAGHDGSLLTH